MHIYLFEISFLWGDEFTALSRQVVYDFIA
jgi:hypothetical protein